MKIIGIIPARYESSRLPGKPLLPIRGASMIARTYQQVLAAKLITQPLVATDDARIFQHVRDFGGEVVMTGTQHLSGTERCAEALQLYAPDADLVLNIQGDEPFIAPELIDEVAAFLMQNPQFDIATAAKKITLDAQLNDTNVVKVVFSASQKALYFSRYALPFVRAEGGASLSAADYFKHIGIYGFRADTLRRIVTLPPARTETAESLEQLRWLHHDYRIGILETTRETIGIDTLKDWEKANE